MNEVTLQLPKSLHQHLEILAEQEAVPLTQYVVHILPLQISEADAVQGVPDDDVAGQRASFDSLLKKWGKILSSEADRILEGRKPVEPEAGLSPGLPQTQPLPCIDTHAFVWHFV